MGKLLEVTGLTVTYGNIPAVSDLSLSVAEGSLVVLLGANGAGKSTTLNSISGLLKPKAGQVDFAGNQIAGLGAHRIARLGLALVPEGRMVVGSLTVEDNLALSSFARGRRGTADLDEIWELFPRLAERRKRLAGLMSGGEQQMLAIARALLTKPSLLLLDEPSMGLSPALVDIVVGAIQRIHAAGVTVLLVEQNASLALPMADYVYILHRGQIAASGTPAELEADPATIALHLGLDTEVTAEEMDGIAPNGGSPDETKGKELP